MSLGVSTLSAQDRFLTMRKPVRQYYLQELPSPAAFRYATAVDDPEDFWAQRLVYCASHHLVLRAVHRLR